MTYKKYLDAAFITFVLAPTLVFTIACCIHVGPIGIVVGLVSSVLLDKMYDGTMKYYEDETKDEKEHD